ncbi:30S ribosomal protein S20 [Frankliniella fusca]|uniref:30S ribosomal protein S20 n=1 Tax=Frankliniella fusca TaxID=407009 RepID=A0AAE1I4A9_9NEOP|nr:30S ribosomal protein S20 [Frankliniella fusca]
MASLLVLVFWLEDRKTSIVELDCVPEEDRDPGKIAKVKWDDGSSYPAQIIKIAKCVKTLEQAEAKFLEKFNSLNNSDNQVQGKRQIKKPLKSNVTAVAVELARTLGEKVELPSELAVTKAAAAREKRFINSHIRQSESIEDSLALQSENVSKVKRSLEFHDDDHDDDDEDDDDTDANKTTSFKRAKVLSDDGIQHQSPTSLTSCVDATPRTRCDKCRALSSNINPTSVEFVRALAQFCGLAPSVQPTFKPCLPSPTSNSDKSEAGQLKPVAVEPGHKRVELTAGSGLFLKKSSKVTSVVSAAGDAEKLTRLIIQDLYGDQLKQKGISALGQGKGKKGIGKTDLKNIYAFISRNSTITCRKGKKDEELQDFTFQEFIRVVNKKLQSASRDRSNNKTAKRKLDLDEPTQSTATPRPPTTPVICAGTPSKSWNVQDNSSTGIQGQNQVEQPSHTSTQLLSPSTVQHPPQSHQLGTQGQNQVEQPSHTSTQLLSPSTVQHPPQSHQLENPLHLKDTSTPMKYSSYHQYYPGGPPSQPFYHSSSYSMPPPQSYYYYGHPNYQHEYQASPTLLDRSTLMSL